MTLEEALVHGVTLHRAGILDEAACVYERILDVEPDHAPTLSYLGLYRYQKGWPDEAETLLRRAVEIDPDYIDGHYNLGKVLRHIDKSEDAIVAYRRAVELDPGHVDSLTGLGDLLFRADRFEEAIEVYRNAVKIDRKCDRALRNLGRIYYRQGFIEAAAKVYRDWLAADPGNPTAAHFLAGCGEGEVPERASDAYLTSEFDEFAETFEKTLGLLGYRAPELCRDAAASLLPEPGADLAVLDAGCGTGLVGPLFRPFAKTLTGIDLSPKMLEAAVAKECYDELIHGELTAFLETDRTFDLIVAADTLIYFGRLDRLLEAVRDALPPDGMFVFSVEADDDTESWSLGPHGRYRHGEAYVRRQLESAGLSTRSFARDWIRRERQIRVFGYVVTAVRT